MVEFWENKFLEERTSWGFEPSDSAILVHDFFLAHEIKSILIPGIGYGRNAKIFHHSGIKVNGIEISKSAIEMGKSENALDIKIHHGSVTDMPFDKQQYDGIFCYAVIHLLNKNERKKFIQDCYNQLKTGGYMFFTVVSDQSNMFGMGRKLSRNRFEVMKHLKVFFYDSKTVQKEFENYGLVDFHEIDEPIKHMDNEAPLKCILAKCQKK